MKQTHIIQTLVMIATVFTFGCHELPKTYDQSNYDTPVELAQASEEFWSEKDPAVITRDPIAIVEFNVEYVTHKMTSLLGDKQMALDAREFSLFGGAATLAGIGRDEIRFDQKMKSELTTRMYDIFVRQLEARGFNVMSPQQVTASATYQRFVLGEPGQKPFMLLNVEGGDTGRVKASQLYPAKDLAILKSVKDGSPKEIAKVISDFQNETGAGTAMRVKFRVGMFKTNPTIESGSTIIIANEHGRAEMKSQKSLVSTFDVITEEQFKLFEGDVMIVDADKYSTGILEIFPAYTSIVLTSLSQ